MLLGVKQGSHMVRVGVVHDSSADCVSEKVRQEVERWLNNIYTLKEGLSLSHTLDVKLRRRTVSSDEICLRTLVDKKRIGYEIRVPLSGGGECICMLYCHDRSAGLELFELARPAAFAFIQAKVTVTDDLVYLVQNVLPQGDRSNIERSLRRHDREVGKLESRDKLAELAFHLNCMFGNKEKITFDQVMAAVRATLGDKVRKDFLPHALHLLIDEAVLEPDIDGRVDPQRQLCFMRGFYLADLLEVYRKTLKEAEIERLEKEIVARNKNLSEQTRSREELDRRRAEVDDRIARIRADIGAKEARLKELEGEGD